MFHTGMAIYALSGPYGELVPQIDPSAFIHPEAVIIGNVTIGAETSVWPAAVLRGDSAAIVIGAQTSVQDGVVIHVAEGLPTIIGNHVTLGHVCHLEGATVHDDALIGVNSVVLHRAVVGAGAIVGAGAVVTADTIVPPQAMALGVPAKIKENAAPAGFSVPNVNTYIAHAHNYPHAMRRID